MTLHTHVIAQGLTLASPPLAAAAMADAAGQGAKGRQVEAAAADAAGPRPSRKSAAEGQAIDSFFPALLSPVTQALGTVEIKTPSASAAAAVPGKKAMASVTLMTPAAQKQVCAMDGEI